MKDKIKSLRKNLEALKEFNFTLKQVPSLIRERDLWLQVFKNMKELNGSWPRALADMRSFFNGHKRITR